MPDHWVLTVFKIEDCAKADRQLLYKYSSYGVL